MDLEDQNRIVTRKAKKKNILVLRDFSEPIQGELQVQQFLMSCPDIVLDLELFSKPKSKSI